MRGRADVRMHRDLELDENQNYHQLVIRPVVPCVALVLVLVLVGCSSNGGSQLAPDPPSDPTQSTSSADSPIITLNFESNGWPSAEVRGMVTLRGGCLLIGPDVAVFPYGTQWVEPNVVFADGTQVQVGTRVSLGGGFYDTKAVTQEGLPIVPLSEVADCASRAGVTGFVWAMP